MQGYYQESGRAGRDGEAAECVLMMAPKDYPRLIQLLRKGGRTSKAKFQAGMELIQHVCRSSFVFSSSPDASFSETHMCTTCTLEITCLVVYLIHLWCNFPSHAFDDEVWFASYGRAGKQNHNLCAKTFVWAQVPLTISQYVVCRLCYYIAN